MSASQLGIHGLYSKPGRKHMAENILSLKGEPSIVIFHNVHVVKLPFKYLCLCLEISADLSFGLRNFTIAWFLAPMLSD